jgi:NAD(P)-dependent dehydrogenase (short-subunit alcohol dehydrogenase family)
MNQQRDLEGVGALVTGASSGIGRAAAEELGRHGAEVVVHGRDAARGSAVVDSITAQGGKARFVAADLTDLAQLDDLVDRAGTVDVLVNNAGFSWFGPTADLDVATFDRLFAANVRAAYFLVGALAPKMAARGAGSILSIASIAGQVGLAGGAVYGATKAALASMTRSWAAEFSPSGVRVNAIAAGPVLTPGAAPERIEALGATTLLSRAAQPGEIAEIIAFLASPKASYITGAVIAADGGRTAI